MMVSYAVTDPDLILPGTVLTIPNLNINMNDAEAKESIKRFFLNIAAIEEQRGRRGTAMLIRSKVQ